MKFPVNRSVFLPALIGLIAITPLLAAGSARGAAVSDEAAALSATTARDYVLQPQDVIRVQVFQEDEINRQTDALSISQDYTVTLPLIGTISLKGKTVRQAERMIRDLYNRDYIVNPQVTLTVVQYAQRFVNVIGSVTNQGRIKFPHERGLSIIDAISLAGGQTRLADMKRVKLTRQEPDGESRTVVVDVDAMMKSGGQDPVMLKPGDIVYVPERIL